MEKILTVVVPVYNMEKYLRKCLDSLILDNNLMPLLEVLVVNDGSKDGSLAIMNEYGAKYPNVFKVIDKENGGHGSCWNYGIRHANGKFISFLDSDDWYDSYAFASLMHRLVSCDTDVVLTKYAVCQKTDEKIIVEIKGLYNDLKDNQIYNCNQYALKDKNVDFFIFWRTIYKTDLLKVANFRFVEHVSYDDILLHLVGIFIAKNFLYMDIVLYHYFVGRVGQSVSLKMSNKIFQQKLKSLNAVFDFYERKFLNNESVGPNSKLLGYKDLIISLNNILDSVYYGFGTYNEVKASVCFLKKQLGQYSTFVEIYPQKLKFKYRCPVFFTYLYYFFRKVAKNSELVGLIMHMKKN